MFVYTASHMFVYYVGYASSGKQMQREKRDERGGAG